ncbi:MAG: hypothetical protein NC820_00100 [Candidatus Omnitrophica bacterium]|nr:hypothetical protein [Candidatus Omnitrophota bacterium]
MRYVDNEKRENEILDILVDSYIKESKPISSSYLCQNRHLPYSSATVRNILESLEKKGFIFHIHISSGRVPTKKGFKHYVESLNKEEIIKREANYDFSEFEKIDSLSGLFNLAIEKLANISGYASIMGIRGREEGIFFTGLRFILEQPEFEDIEKMRAFFYALEVKINEVQQLLLNNIDEELKILIGDEIGFEEFSGCSLLVSGIKENNFNIALGVLGPMRMNYIRALVSLYSIKCILEDVLEKRFL